MSLNELRSTYVVGSRVPEILLAIVFIFSLITSLYLSNYLLISAVGLLTYTYAVLVGHVMYASITLLISLPFQFLVAGPYVIHLIAYYPAVLIVKSVIYLRRSYVVFVPAFVPVFIYFTLFHSIIEVPPLHYLLVSCVALLVGYFLRVYEELISFGITYLEVPELNLLSLFSVGRVLSMLGLTYSLFAFSTSVFFVSLSYGLVFTQSLFLSVVLSFFFVLVWLLARKLVLRVALILISSVLMIVTEGFWLLGVFDEFLRLLEEVLRYFG